MLSEIFQLIIIVAFLLLSGRYMYVNSLRKKPIRHHSLEAAGFALYYLPVFLQGILLLCAGLIYCYFLTRDFFYLLESLFHSDNSFAPDFSGLSIVFPGALLMSVNCWLANISCNKRWDINAIGCKLLYIIYSVLMIKLISVYSTEFTSAIFYPFQDSASSVSSFPITLVIAWLLLLFAAFLVKKGGKFTMYLKLPVLTVTVYTCFCFAVALVCYCLLNFFRLLHFP